MPLVSEFLCERLANAGIKHVFGVDGFYIKDFVATLNQSERIKFIQNVDENHSGFAADAYARSNGIGCVCATYNIGALKLCNSIAGAYAERSPVIVIGGSPGTKERNKDFLSNHVVESFSSQHEIFKQITSHSVVLDNSTSAGWKIDNALDILRETKQPIYIEVPRDILNQPIKYDVYTQGTPNNQKSDPASLKEAIEDISSFIKASSNPVIVMGVQTARFNLEEPLIKFAEKHNIPIVTTLLSKSSISESHPLFQGVYFGEQTRRQEVKELVHNSDCLLIFGEMLTDISLGFVSPKFDNNNTIFCSVEHVRVKNHIYCGIRFVDFCKEFFKSDVGKKNQISSNKSEVSIFSPIDGEKIILKRFFEKLNTVLNDNLMVIADIGEGLFDTADLTVSHHRFISSAFYCSMGLAIPGSLGAQLSRPEVRPLVIVGEGSFKSSSCEISTLIDNKLNPIIFILTTKQGLLKSWNYHKIFDMISGGLGCVVETERDLEEAISSSLKKNCISIVNVILDCPSLR